MEHVTELGGFFKGCETFGWVIAEDTLPKSARYPDSYLDRALTLVMIISSRSVYQGLRQKTPVVRVGEKGRYR